MPIGARSLNIANDVEAKISKDFALVVVFTYKD